MKAKLLPVLLLLGVGACTPNETPVRILDTFGLKGGGTSGECEKSDLQQGAGSLDISVRGSYLIALRLTSEINDTSNLGGIGNFVGGDDRNSFEIQQAVLTYTSTPRLSFVTETLPVHLLVRQEASDDTLIAPLIGPKAAEVLSGNVAASDQVELIVSLQLRGVLLSGQALSTNTIKYPITIFNSGTAACAATDRPALNGPCGGPGGQDGVPYLCCSTAPTADGCM